MRVSTGLARRRRSTAQRQWLWCWPMAASVIARCGKRRRRPATWCSPWAKCATSTKGPGACAITRASGSGGRRAGGSYSTKSSRAAPAKLSDERLQIVDVGVEGGRALGRDLRTCARAVLVKVLGDRDVAGFGERGDLPTE